MNKKALPDQASSWFFEVENIEVLNRDVPCSYGIVCKKVNFLDPGIFVPLSSLEMVANY
jgi:hypothetical protein